MKDHSIERKKLHPLKNIMAITEDFHETMDYGHGCIEDRKCVIIRNLNSILNKDCWKNLHSIVRLESKRIFNKIAQNIIRKDKDEKRFAHKIGMNSKRLMAGWNDDYLMDLLNLL